MLLARDEALPQTRRAGTKTHSVPTLCFPPGPDGVPQSTLGLRLVPYLLPSQGGRRIFFLTPSGALCPPLQFRKGSPPHPHTPHTLSPSCLLPTPQERADVDLKEVKSTSAALLWSLVIHRAGRGESTGKEGGEKATRDILYNSKAQRSVQTGNRQLS